MPFWSIHIEGQVQGVGFRPTVLRVAYAMGLCGKVFNTNAGVTIDLFCSKRELDEFLKKLRSKLSSLAVISKLWIEELPKIDSFPNDFYISPSLLGENKSANISPDFGICPSCQSEVLNSENPRYLYPFISCTQCGPRYSILNGIPYDRLRSSMGHFEMCTSCEEEYLDLQNRRFHSQTNSCPDCPIDLRIFPETDHTFPMPVDLMDHAVTIIQSGGILAVKGTGGFLLLTDATNPDAIQMLRKRKRRPRKPLALMVHDEIMLSDFFTVSHEEKELLRSAARPIVLCKPKKYTDLHGTQAWVAPGLSLLGVCLPADPLMFLISRKVGRPIIATSGNLHQSPLQYKDQEAIEKLMGFADAIIYHNREIYFPQDDSVFRIAENSGQKIVLRRSRGLAPTFWNKVRIKAELPVLALGADLKGTFALWEGHNVYVSQYLGNLESFDTQERYLDTLTKFLDLTGIQPQQILMDKHPLYHSRRFADNFPYVNVTEVPHHEAHFAALLWEHAALDADEPILGVIWDGLGFGNDSALWGSEFFVFHSGAFERACSFDYYDYLLGDKMSIEPRLSALAICYISGGTLDLIKGKFSSQEWSLFTRMLDKGGHAQTNSMGRLFDAVSSILGLCDFNTYEGEAAMLLEQLARNYFDANGQAAIQSYFMDSIVKDKISGADLISQIIKDKSNGLDSGLIAAKFHLTLVHIISQVIQNTGCRKVGFSGGVFQNALLVDLLHQYLGEEYQLLFHEQLPPNDENISLGQMAWFHIKNRSQKLKIKSYVLGDSR
ncbi:MULTISPECIES: carbamoyltransferase HypF [Cecembia]|uniref:Carbamoyltransferase n=3 Tax=Cecembia TaxID=1187078 RepID=A0A4Q7PDW2_9BACT|nr:MULTISPECIES: carbamoyltransferase HypF [Cecembia]PSL03844.1 hydrogenase maturation carbamoyltransferase HypF [Cecembia rubra]RZS98571.1 hydrogenase maturation carbamoyltransferase HypF [Cecembia calidifontis]